MSAPEKKAKRPMWAYTPELPIKHAVYVDTPTNLWAIVKEEVIAWMPTNVRFYALMVSLVIYAWFLPDMARMETWGWDWFGEILLRNYVLIILVAGGLHLWLFTFKGQGEEEHYDTRPLATDSIRFDFRHQTKDNMLWTFVGVPIGTLWECFMLWCYANGYAEMVSFSESPVYFIVIMALIPFWSGTHFYFLHRALHFPFLYKWIHSWHHRNTNVGPWSGHAMHPAEHFGLYSDVLIFLLVASHPIHLLFNLMLHTMNGPISHTGYDKLKVGPLKIQVGDFFHQLHHRFFDCNYGITGAPWDKWFHSFHDGTPEGNKLINERRRMMNNPELKP